MITANHTEQKGSRFSRALTVFCFMLAAALLIMSLVQASHAGAGQYHVGFQLPESQVLSLSTASKESGFASPTLVLTGPATR